jgi:hypothetical protein
MKTPMMKCGHAANATQSYKGGTRPACAICAGHPDAHTIADTPDLSGRRARCAYFGTKCKSEVDSSTEIAFFEYQPDQEYDEFYCGCFGWN